MFTVVFRAVHPTSTEIVCLQHKESEGKEEEERVRGHDSFPQPLKESAIGGRCDCRVSLCRRISPQPTTKNDRGKSVAGLQIHEQDTN